MFVQIIARIIINQPLFTLNLNHIVHNSLSRLKKPGWLGHLFDIFDSSKKFGGPQI